MVVVTEHVRQEEMIKLSAEKLCMYSLAEAIEQSFGPLLIIQNQSL